MNLTNNRKAPGWYYRLSSFFKDQFGEAVYKIPLDAGFSCPNRDGTIGLEGCTYCYNPSFAPFSNRDNPLSLSEQLAKGKKKSGSARYLAYFQSYTNTYAPVEELRILYDQALSDPEVIGLSIATRPDCVTDEILKLLENYAASCHLWIEYGLQSAHDITLKRINRGHDSAAFANVVEKTKNRGIYICAHIILGLPGETEEMMLETIAFLNKCGVDGVKFHHLQIIRETALEKDYAAGKITIFNNTADYIPVLCSCLERLSSGIVVHRLASQATSIDLLIAPHWQEGAGQIASMVEEELKKRGTWQGALTENK
ncbi:MAG: TIGR01212 family radical SAM protein [Firmicutes bacterium]|nr:TIGR01212 family radical SAM protein [Bacillota bacterium]